MGSDISVYIIIIMLIALIVYLAYMRNKVKKFVLRNDKISKYYR